MALMGTHQSTQRHAAPGAEPRHHSWPLLLIAAPAAVAVWSGWVGLGSMCGFGVIHPLPGIWDAARLNTAITLPVGVEAYGTFALYVWLSGSVSQETRLFARNSALGALALGCLGQIAFHLLVAAHWTVAPWPVVVAVACLPVVTLALAATLFHRRRADTGPAKQAEPEAAEAIAEASPEAIAEAAPEAVSEPLEVPSEPAEIKPAEVPTEEPVPVPPVVPAEEPVREPEPRVVRIVKSPEAERGRAEYRKSVRQGQPLSDRALGAKFGKSRTWGASRIREVDEGPALTAQAQ